MTCNIPLINGTYCYSLTIYSKEKFLETVNFYSEIFELKQSVSDEFSCVLSNGLINVKITLEEDIEKSRTASLLRETLKLNISNSDWRCLSTLVAFSTTQIQSIKSRVSHFQVYPSDLDPVQLFFLDPQGNVVGVTQTKNACSTMPTFPRTKDEILRHSSYIPVSTEVSSVNLTSLNTSVTNSLVLQGNEKSVGKSIAVMTSGGDAPGMNANVRAIVRSTISKGCRAFVIMEGYEGLVRGGPDYIKEFTWEDVRGWSSEGGTNIGTARCMAFKERQGRLKGAKNLIEAGVNALIVCGGDGSLTGADLFRSEWPSLIEELRSHKEITQQQFETYKHLNICGTVGSIDNDMSTTDATIGAYSSLDRICEAIDYIEATANSHSRAFVVEVMGRNCGWLALMAGIATSADYILIPEKPASSREWQDQMCDIVSKHRSRGKRTTIIIISEGAITADLKPISPNDVRDTLVDRLGLDTRVTILGHVQRGGNAVAFDRILAALQGVEAVEAVLESTPETPSPLIAINENKIVRNSLVESVKLTKSVAEAIQAKNFKKAMELRDSEFVEHLSNFMSINSADHIDAKLPSEKRLNIAIVNIGAPAGGMNSVVYSMACYCMSQGHKPYAIYNGWVGLSKHESVRSLNWKDMIGWQSRGGSEIGTNRLTPEEADIGMVAYYFQKYQFDGLVIVGGFEAFISLHQLEKARENYTAFRIPMVLIPATLSNNVPGTEYSLGTDTALNALMEYCDVVKQSASSTRGRVFVVDVQGGNSGYLTTNTALAVGAQASYVPEEGISLDQLQEDIQLLKESFASSHGRGRFGKLILKAANASKVFTPEVLASVITSEADGKFDARCAIPGHVQQGEFPSAIDRTKGTRLAIRAINFIELNQDILIDVRSNDTDFDASEKGIEETATVLGIKGSHVIFTSVRKLYRFDTELSKRMPKEIHWDRTRVIADQLVGRKKVVV